MLSPAFSGDGFVLGSVAPYIFRLDAHNRILTADSIERAAYSGGAKRFAGLVALSPKQADLVWKGGDLPFEPDGYLYPLTEDRLGIYQRDKLVIVSLRVNGSYKSVELINRYPFTNLETVVSSPDGRYDAWLWTSSSESHLQVAHIDERKIVNQGTINHVGFFPTFAVNNRGVVTLANSEKPNSVFAWSLESGVWTRRASGNPQL